MDTIGPGPIFDDPEDQAGSDPKAGGLDKPGSDGDDPGDQDSD